MKWIASLVTGLVLLGVVGCGGAPPPAPAEAVQAQSTSDCAGQVCGARQICCVTPCTETFCTTAAVCHSIDCAAP